MLYSIGKDSSVLLHLALKAFYPGQAAVPAAARRHDLEVPRDDRVPRPARAASSGSSCIVHINPDGVARGINPFTHGSAVHTDVMKTEALRQALDEYGFDAAFGGARRDEEKSRAKERVFSFRNAHHRWDPKQPAARAVAAATTRASGRARSIRVFPLSNWTELDIWHYIHRENIPIVPLYFAAERPVVERDGTLIMVDDDRLPLEPGETPRDALGALPHARLLPADRRGRDRPPTTLADIIHEMLRRAHLRAPGPRSSTTTAPASMEHKKQEGYF